MHVVIFEGAFWRNFAPLSIGRPVFSLISGMSTLLDRQVRHLKPSRLTLWVRPEMAEYCRSRIVPALHVPTVINEPLDDEPALLLAGRVLILSKYDFPTEPCVDLGEDGLVVSAFVKDRGLSFIDMLSRTDRWLRIRDLPKRPAQGRHVSMLADLVGWNEESLIEDMAQLRGKPSVKKPGPYHFVNEDEIWIGEGARLQPGCVLDASKGPIVLADNASIGANAVVYGPCYIGPYSQISALAVIRPGTTIGTMCKVGGEVANSVIMGFTNKAHEGYLGDSYVGKWVNLGAGTTTSNLKNTYGEIRLQIGARSIDTGRRFLGSLIGDHAKTAIHTRLMTGSYVGFSSTVAGDGSPPKFIPSFWFWDNAPGKPFQIDKAIEVARRVFARRERAWTKADDSLMRYAHSIAPSVEE
jgi:UDP-N-acetylglucosamine diphosphorylase/glucosamine-1-phosphate N-acetyltransferase